VRRAQFNTGRADSCFARGSARTLTTRTRIPHVHYFPSVGQIACSSSNFYFWRIFILGTTHEKCPWCTSATTMRRRAKSSAGDPKAYVPCDHRTVFFLAYSPQTISLEQRVCGGSVGGVNEFTLQNVGQLVLFASTWDESTLMGASHVLSLAL